MSAKTLSFCQGKGSLSHNNRTFTPKNVDSSRTKENITFVKIPIAEAYENCFSEAVERYNAKQKRADRRIKNGYFDYAFSHAPYNNVITAPDKRKSFYEDIVQIGCKDDTGTGTVDGKLAVECLKEYMENFQKRNPNFYVFNAVLHNDEATPHLHIDYIPIGHYKRGVDTQNGLAQALKEMGYGEGENAISRWRAAEVKVLTEICIQHGIEILAPHKSRGYSFKVDEYKQHKDTINALEQHKGELFDDCYKLECERRATNKILNEAMAEADKFKKESSQAKAEVERVKLEAQRTKEEAKQAELKAEQEKDNIALEKRVLALNKSMLIQMLQIQSEDKKRLVEEMEKIKTEYSEFLEMKERFIEVAKAEIIKMKDENKRNAYTNQINSNMSRFELTAEMEEYVSSITKRRRSKDNDFSL